jgi:hypothetical protein
MVGRRRHHVAVADLRGDVHDESHGPRSVVVNVVTAATFAVVTVSALMVK